MRYIALLCVLMGLGSVAYAGLFDNGTDNCSKAIGAEYQCSFLKRPIYLQPNGAVTFPFIHCNDADVGSVQGGALFVVLRGSIADTYVKIPLSALAGIRAFKMPLEVPYSHVRKTSTCRRIQ